MRNQSEVDIVLNAFDQIWPESGLVNTGDAQKGDTSNVNTEVNE